MASCCKCACSSGGGGGAQSSLPLLCLVPREGKPPGPGGSGSGLRPGPSHGTGPVDPSQKGFKLLDNAYIKKNFKLPQRALYLDPFKRPLITFPMTQEGRGRNFNMERKQKINQQILDGFLDPSEAITAPSVFPYAKSPADKKKEEEEDEEIIYILQLPDWESKCPVHGDTIRTPRFIWHSCKKSKKESGDTLKQGRGPLHKPKPWLLSRHTDFDLLSQW